MKLRFLLGGTLLVSASAFAQAQPAPAPAGYTVEPSGYDLLVQAGKAILQGPNGSPSAPKSWHPKRI